MTSGFPPLLEVRSEVAAALSDRRPVVALESTLIAHGLPWPINLETARLAEQAVHDAGALPATIAVWHGRPVVGLTDAEIVELAQDRSVLKASRRDLAAAMARKATAATTVAGTMAIAAQAGIRFFATGGIGGVHPGERGDVSADLFELAQTPMAVVCAGAKSILDLPRTLEALESLSVPVIGFGVDEFPAFYLRTSSLSVPFRIDSLSELAALLTAHWQLGGASVVVALPVAEELALTPGEWQPALGQVEKQAEDEGVRGAALTPFLLARLAVLTEGRSLRANQGLVVANARLAGELAVAFQAQKD